MNSRKKSGSIDVFSVNKLENNDMSGNKERNCRVLLLYNF